MNPDETQLAMWLEDELQGAECAALEAWMSTHTNRSEYVAQRDEARAWRSQMSAWLPATEEPPYPDFFNQRIAQAIRQGAPKSARRENPWFSWKSWCLPAAACAGMAMTFWLGMQNRPASMEVDVSGAPKAIPVDPILYTPETGVVANYFSSPGASATVIVLSGVDAIPDETDFSETACFKATEDRDSTAGIEADQPQTQER